MKYFGVASSHQTSQMSAAALATFVVVFDFVGEDQDELTVTIGDKVVSGTAGLWHLAVHTHASPS